MPRLAFSTDHPRLAERFDAALVGLAGNVRHVRGSPHPVLADREFSNGLRLDIAPHAALVYACIDPALAFHNHQVFFDCQRPDGLFPARVEEGQTCFGWLQAGVPLARSAWELCRLFPDEAFLRRAYSACSAYDAWLRRHRNARGTGLVECFCERDTGQAHGPRFEGLPRGDWEGDAARPFEGFPALPYLAPDLSATAYGGRRALADMARALGKADEARQWDALAERQRQATFKFCYDPVDLCFYDRRADGELLKIRGESLLRVLAEHVPEPPLAEAVFRRHVLNPRAFWTPYPLPSIAADDPRFGPRAAGGAGASNWDGPSQALTALRAPGWFEHYGFPAEHARLMRQWVEAILRRDHFGPRIDPFSGDMDPPGGYTPTMLLLIDSVMRLHGAREEPDRLAWTASPRDGATAFHTRLETARGALTWESRGKESVAAVEGRETFRLTGHARILTDRAGVPTALVGVGERDEAVTLSAAGRERRLTLKPNEVATLT